MKSFQMKALAVAMLGLGGLVMAGSAAAACSNPTPFSAWSSWNPGNSTNVGAAFGGSTVAADGLASTSCAMAASFTAAGASLGEQAIVYDNSPQKEQTYRFRFYIDPTAISSNLSSLNTVAIFGARSALTHGANSPTNQVVQMYLNGDGTNVFLRTFAGCTTGDNQTASRCRAASDLQLPTPFAPNGVRIEGQVVIGAAGTGKVNIWVGSNVNPSAPDATINVDNAAWGTASTDGVKQAQLGLSLGSASFQSAGLNKAVLFDEFDSRRQTFIGL